MLAVRKELAELEPGVPHRRQEIADAHTSSGKAARKAGQLDRALQHDAVACSIFASLMEADPGMADYVSRLSNAEGRLALDYMSYKTRDADETARETFMRARKRLIELNVEAPGLKKRIAGNIAAINGNLEKLNRRLMPSEETVQPVEPPKTPLEPFPF